MNINVEITKDPNIIKFVCDIFLTNESYEYSKKDVNSQNPPFIKELINMPFIETIFITANFIAISKNNIVNWKDVVDTLIEIINFHFNQNTLLNTQNLPFEIYAQTTPNPLVIKFICNRIISKYTVSISRNDDYDNIPICCFLFEKYYFLDNILLNNNFISVKFIKEFNEILETYISDIRSSIRSYMINNGEIYHNNFKFKNTYLNNYSEIENKIDKLIEDKIRHYLVSDGGNITVIKYINETKTLILGTQGACSGCPSSENTINNGIKMLINEYYPGLVDKIITNNYI